MKIEFRKCKQNDISFILELKELGMKWYIEKNIWLEYRNSKRKN